MVLLAASWEALFRLLGLPGPRPAFFAQLLGVALAVLALVEWRIAGRPGQREVALALALGSAAGAGVLGVWLAGGKTGAEPRGQALLWIVALLLAAAAVLHALAWRARRP